MQTEIDAQKISIENYNGCHTCMKNVRERSHYTVLLVDFLIESLNH